jgi:uncharacterized protein YaeQ
MALKSTIHKLELSVANVDRHYYENHTLTLARHPSETEQRLMVRVVAFALHADPLLSYGKGLSDDGEPALRLDELSGETRLWVDLGHPDERRIRKACGLAANVAVYCYSERGSPVWWEQNGPTLARHQNLTVAQLAVDGIEQLAARTMALQCTIDGGVVWLADDHQQYEIPITVLQQPD